MTIFLRDLLRRAARGLFVAVVAVALAPIGSPLDAAHSAPPRNAPRKPVPKPTPKPVPETPSEPTPEPVLQRSNRMELDARLVRGETARSGAVYLFQRAPRRLPPLVNLEQSYLDEIVLPVMGASARAPADEALDRLDAQSTLAPEPATPPATPGPRPRGGR